MHPVLFLDEILRLIFEDCDRKYLVSAALTCTAWKDPALDVVWNKLDSSKPWFDFLENPVEFQSFIQYARRVKHIVLRHNMISQDKCFEDVALTFPKLRTVRLALTKSASPLTCLHHSSDLETIDISLGFKSRPIHTDILLTKWFQNIAHGCDQLRHIRLRGSIPEGVNTSLCNMTTLQSASLRLGNSMLPGVLEALGTFPSLSELEVHVGHITTGAVPGLLDAHQTAFPVLTKLHIRGKSAFLEAFLSYLSPMTLRHLHVELDDETAYADTWLPVLQAIATKASNSLQHLLLEHHYILDDIQEANSTANPPAANSTPHVFTLSLPTITFSDISSLRSLKRLERLSCNITLPPLLTDPDFEQILSWWPYLKHLDLGTFPNQKLIPSFPITLSAKALSFAAGRAPQLEYLSVPCPLDDSFCCQNITSNVSESRLRSLLVSTIKGSDSFCMAEYLRRLFPFLQSLESTDDTDDLSDVINHLIPLAVNVRETPFLC